MSAATTLQGLRLSESHIRAMKSHAEWAYPYECCGLLVGRGDATATRVIEVVRAVNIAEGDRRRSYQIDWSTLLTTQRRAREEHFEIVGFYHSHPDGSVIPSERDRREAWVDYAYLIIPVSNGQAGDITVWRLLGDNGTFVAESLVIHDEYTMNS